MAMEPEGRGLRFVPDHNPLTATLLERIPPSPDMCVLSGLVSGQINSMFESIFESLNSRQSHRWDLSHLQSKQFNAFQDERAIFL